ncbi:hypothetical protein [Sandarakinorhabdus rubra]|uniref:hypothetical protein n=1 Tax=Sandarakinorhabdus rubra TaxID=2672568 RepID=UPI0013DD25E9|nr:hypothetical protein [Sandarakinorhabdus rubra]
MSYIRAYFPLAVIALALAACAWFRPAWIGDCNELLAKFVNEQLVNVLGVVLAISLASLAQLHLSLNALEERRGQPFLANVRREIRQAAWWLIGLFAVGVVAVLAKQPLAALPFGALAVNALALWIVCFYVLILLDITFAVFNLEPEFPRHDDTP